MLTELTLAGHASVTDRGARDPLVAAASERAPSDPILREGWNYLNGKPRGAQTIVAAVGPPLREPLLDRLVGRGDLTRERRKALGIFPATKLSEGPNGRRAELMRRVRAALVDGEPPAPRTAVLAALLSASGALPTLHREIPWTSPVISRAAEFQRGDWGAGAAAEAVMRTTLAIAVNAVVAAAATTRT